MHNWRQKSFWGKSNEKVNLGVRFEGSRVNLTSLTIDVRDTNNGKQHYIQSFYTDRLIYITILVCSKNLHKNKNKCNNYPLILFKIEFYMQRAFIQNSVGTEDLLEQIKIIFIEVQ